MLPILRTNKGISLIEAMIAVFLASTAVLAVASMQDLSIRTAAGADYRGRATEVAQAQMTEREVIIMATGVPPGNFVNVPVTVDNIPFTVNTATAAVNANLWTLSVTVTWPGNAVGVTNNRLITTQMGY